MSTILVADDSLFMRTVVKGILAGKYDVFEADSGRSCLEQFESKQPDLVLLDVVMPEGSAEGLNVLKRIISRDPSAKVVMISAVGNQDAIVDQCLTLGAKGFLRKPFNERQVLTLVEEALH